MTNAETAADLTPLVGQWAAALTSLLTLLTFGLALTAIPISGPFCPADQWECVEDTHRPEHRSRLIAQWPNDYWWMVAALPQLLAYLALMAAVHSATPEHAQVVSMLALCLSVMACSFLFGCYFLQLSFVQASLIHDDVDGVAAMTMYNEHGIFIALEEAGYLCMSASLLALAVPGVGGANSSIGDKGLRMLLAVAGFLGIVALPGITFWYGWNDRSYRYEVAVISIDWLTLIAAGPLWMMHFSRLSKKSTGTAQKHEKAH